MQAKIGKFTLRKVYLLPGLLGLTSIVSAAQFEASYYWDDRTYNSITLQVSARDLGAGFSVWGFTDFHGDQANAARRYDMTRSFSEYRLSNDRLGQWLHVKGLGVQLEFNDATAGNSDASWRTGLTWHIKTGPLWMLWRAFPLQGNANQQASVAWNLRLHDRLHLSGFADANVLSDKTVWVVEPQLNLRLLKPLWLLLEYRYHGFERLNPLLDGEGWALGLRYHLP